jgi:allantoinase
VAQADEKFPALFAIASSRVVTCRGEVAAAIVIEHGIIRDVCDRAELPAEIPVTDFGDLVVSPGVVDAHVHVNEPGRTEWEGFATATAAAAIGGVTTIIDMPLNSTPVTTTVEALNAKRSAAQGKCCVDVGFYGGLVPGNESEIESLVEAGVLGIKAFMCDSGLDEFPAAGESELRLALEALKSFGIPLLAHAEIVGAGPPIKEVTSHNQYSDSRPQQFETDAIELLIKLCREYDTPVHVVHLAASNGIELIRAAKQSGLRLTVETCPHYLFFSTEEIEDGQTQFKCAPPIRNAANRKALCSAVSEGLIETIGSDHSPCPPELKHLDDGDFTKAWGGIAGLQLTLSAIATLGREFAWTPSLLAERLSVRPAEIFGLGKKKGRIKKGYDADLVVWDPEESFIVSGQQLAHRHDVTPYEGRELFGVVKRTFVRGQLVSRDGELVGKPCGDLIQGIPANSLALLLNQVPTDQCRNTLETCCASRAWINRMIDGGDFKYDVDVLNRAKTAWEGVGEDGLLEAFSAHPRIGDVDSLREKYANTKAIAGGEQAGVNSASESTLQRLADANDEYFDKFGFIFIVCATGKTAQEMLNTLESRLPNDRATELRIAAAEQLKITKIRLRKLIS